MTDNAGDVSPSQPAQSGTSESSGGSSWWKWLLGCGCLGFMALMCTGVAGVAYSGYVMKSVYDSARKGVEVRSEVIEKRKKLVEREDFKVSLEEPLSAGDYDEFQATIDDWRDTEPFREIESLADEDDSGGEKSFFEQMRIMYKIWKSATALQKLGTLYIETVEEHGGIEPHYQRLLRIGAVVAAAHEVSSDHRFERPGEPASDEVAELLYEQNDKVLKAYGDKIDELRSGSPTFQELAQSGDLGTYAVATLPTESYAPWNGYSVEEREKLIERFAWGVVAESLTFGGFAFPVTFGKKLPVGG